MSWFVHPLTKGLDIDAPETTCLRRQIIREKVFLRRVYEEWYISLVREIPQGEGAILEIGAGAGFLKELRPEVIASEYFFVPGIDVVLDGGALPFADGSLKAIIMTNVLHHLPQPGDFFREATRCLRPEGVVAMVEPWSSPWSRLIYTRLHHEPFRSNAQQWSFDATGPLSGANAALPWIVFGRDRALFEKSFPLLKLHSIEPLMPFRYLLSGGVSLVSLQPGWTFGLWRGLERLFCPWMGKWAMFARIILRRVDE
jgi:SAM-dependent methyltransferase